MNKALATAEIPRVCFCVSIWGQAAAGVAEVAGGSELVVFQVP
jgi:hypothetical protein